MSPDSKPQRDPHDLHGAVERFKEFRGKKVVGVAASPHGVVLRFEGGLELGPLSRFTGIMERNMVTTVRR